MPLATPGSGWGIGLGVPLPRGYLDKLATSARSITRNFSLRDGVRRKKAPSRAGLRMWGVPSPTWLSSQQKLSELRRHARRHARVAIAPAAFPPA